MAKQYYATCNVNGPISVSIEANTIEEAVEIFDEMDKRSAIDDAESAAEDDLGFCGDGMTEDDFADAMESHGYRLVQDLAAVANYHSGTVAHEQDGWQLFGEK